MRQSIICYGIGKEHLCPICGRKFTVPFTTRFGGGASWVYRYRKKNKTIYICSYKCWMAKD